MDFAKNNTWFNRKLIKGMPRSAWCQSRQTYTVVEGEGTSIIVAPVAVDTVVTVPSPVMNSNVTPVPRTTPPFVTQQGRASPVGMGRGQNVGMCLASRLLLK